MDEERNMMARLRRRLCGERASVMLEFAFVAPLVFSVAIFATDFTRVLRTEQQLEIAARLAADIESHVALYTKADTSKTTPSTAAKTTVKTYLHQVARVVAKSDYAYIKGDSMMVGNLLSKLFTEVDKFISGRSFSADGGNLFVKLVVNTLGKVVGGLLNLVTFRTDRYITEIFPHDREIRMTVAAYIPTILPAELYDGFALGWSDRPGAIGVWQSCVDLSGADKTFGVVDADSLKMIKTQRHRVYCYMPVMDSVPIAPTTYVRSFLAWANKQTWMKGIFK